MTELAAALASLPASEGLENSAQATLIRQAIGRVAEQYQLAGDTVPQVVTISERSSAEPLPPPPGKSGDNKIAVSARNRISNLGEPSGKTAARETSKPAAAKPANAVPRNESEDTAAAVRPLLLTNPKIPAPRRSPTLRAPTRRGAATASTAAKEAASGTPPSAAAGGRKSGKHRPASTG